MHSIAERLLRAGIAPRHVRRYLAELRDHLADLVEDEERRGRPGPEAERNARRRLGTDQDLAAAMIARPELRSWTARAPWATLLLGPILLLVAASLLSGAGIVATGMALGSYAHPDGHLDVPAWLAAATTPFLQLGQRTLPLLIGWGIAVVAIRRRCGRIWPAIGLIAVAFLGSAIQVGIRWPTATAPGFLDFHLPYDPFLATIWGRSFETGLLNLALTAGPLAAFLKKRDSGFGS